jgi:phosphoribosyl 1,2-cyclic phosphate phosphodiesterase
VRVEFLGTGGAVTTPRPLCLCRVCAQARVRGVPYSRSGPSVFVHGPDVLVDTPEEIKGQIDRSRVTNIAACFYSHWHPDHVLGRRVWEALNQDWRGWPPEKRTTDIYLPEQVGKDFRSRLGMWDALAFYERDGILRIVELADGETVEIGGTRIRPFRVAEDYVYAFEFEVDGKRALVASDELNGWQPAEELRGLDLAVLPVGVFEFDPFTGERRISEEHPVLGFEATFEETLEIVGALGAERTILTHVEEMDGLTHDYLQRLAENLRREGRNVEFAYDTLLVEV